MNLSIATSITRAVRWHRRSLAAIAAGVAVLALINVLSPPGPATTPVLVTITAVPPGAVLSQTHLELRPIPRDYVPEDAFSDTAEVVGKTVSAGLSRGTIVTRQAVVDSQTSARPGETLVPFRIADAGIADLLRVGDQISVVGGDQEGGPQVLVTDARVAALPTPLTREGMGVATESGAMIVIATDAQSAQALAAVASTTRLGITLG